MSYGTNVKVHLKYPYRVFKDLHDIEEEKKKLDREEKEEWNVIRRLVFTNPADYVSANGDERWNTFEHTLKSLERKFDDAWNKLIENAYYQEKLVWIEDFIDFNKDKDGEWQMHQYGCKGFFTDILENLGCPVKEYGTEILGIGYLNRDGATSVDDICSLENDIKEKIDLLYSELKDLALVNPSNFIQCCQQDDDNSDDEEHITSFKGVMSYLDSVLSSDYEWFIECAYKLARYRICLEDIPTVTAYFEEVIQRENKRKAWMDEKENILSEICQKFGVTSTSMFTSDKRDEIYEEYDRVLKEKGLHKSPCEDDD